MQILTAHLIHEDETFPSVLRERAVVFSIDIREFHALDAFWNAVNAEYGLNITYFSDEIIRFDIVDALLSGSKNMFHKIKIDKLKTEILELFAVCKSRRLGLVFVCD